MNTSSADQSWGPKRWFAVQENMPENSIGKDKHYRNMETPFSMTYRAEVVIPLETGFPTLRTSSFTPSNNDELLGKILDLIEEQRENAMV